MKYLSLLLLAFCLSIAPAKAEDEDPARKIVDASDPKEELAESLEDFIGRAVEEGLLERAGDEQAETEFASNGLPTNCSPIFGIDFEVHSRLSVYEDLYKVKEAVGRLPKTEEVKMRIALGLYSEARALLDTVDKDSSFLFNMANLLENHETPNVEYFGDFENCGVIGSFWHSTSLLAVHDASGVEGVREGVKYFRTLPLQIRVDLATIIVPALDGFGERLLANKVMTSFSAEEAEGSSSLQFNLALLDQSSEEDIGDFIIRPEFRSAALRAALQRDEKLSSAQKDLLLEEFARIIKTESDDRRIITGLKFALKEFAARSDVAQMVELSKMPNLQSPAAQNTILQKIASTIQKNLNADDQLVVLSGIQALIDYSDTLDGHPATAGLYPVAAEKASSTGYKSLAAKLSDRGLRRTDNLLQEANIAFGNLDAETLYKLARANRDIAPLSLLAARAALKTGDNAQLKEFEVRLLDAPELALELAQADAVQGSWAVSEAVYAAATTSSDESIAGRARNILNLRRTAIRAQQTPSIQLSQADEILGKKTTSLQPGQERTN